MSGPQPGLPLLRHISIAAVEQSDTIPTLKIRTDEDVEQWKLTQGYQDYGLFLRRISESVVGYFLPWASSSPSKVSIYSVLVIYQLISMLIGGRGDRGFIKHS